MNLCSAIQSSFISKWRDDKSGQSARFARSAHVCSLIRTCAPKIKENRSIGPFACSMAMDSVFQRKKMTMERRKEIKKGRKKKKERKKERKKKRERERTVPYRT